MALFLFDGAPGEIRTPDLLVRSQTLYPTELRAQKTVPTSLLTIPAKQGYLHSESCGGERGIRTLDGLLTHTPLAGARLRPLGHLSAANSVKRPLSPNRQCLRIDLG